MTSYINTNVPSMRIKVPNENKFSSTSPPLLRFILPFLILTSPITSFCIPSNPFITRQTTTQPSQITTTKASTQQTLTSSSDNDTPPQPPAIIPITTLSGFLGSGKTTLLTHLLQNTKLKIALIVNDVAKINIDSKLISSTTSSGNVINLSNGCACCSLSDDLLTSVSELVTISDLKMESEERFDAIVVECSGVSEPKGIRNVFQEGELYGMPLMERVRLDTMVTVVDGGSFLRYLKSDKKLTLDESPELLNTLPPPPPELDHLPAHILSALNYATDLPSHTSSTGVSSLLISQIETADVLILNKIDLLSSDDDQLDDIKSVLTALNPRAVILTTAHGRVDVEEVLNSMKGEGVAMAGMVDDHRESVVRVMEGVEEEEGHNHDSHEHDHAHTPVGHDHNHDHAPAHDHATHDHNHDHAPAHDHATHDHNHESSSSHDTSHSHTHTHQSSSTSHHSFIKSFVYTARKPFHPQRLSKLLSHLPVSMGLPCSPERKDVTDLMKGLLRSKGFCWLGCSDIAAMYWSHAGNEFEMQCWGRWWATLNREHWPSDAIETILADFDSPTPSPTSVGDRRQEIVFIGTELNQDLFQKLFDDALLTDEEYELYQKLKGEGDERLKEEFGNGGFDVKMVTY